MGKKKTDYPDLEQRVKYYTEAADNYKEQFLTSLIKDLIIELRDVQTMVQALKNKPAAKPTAAKPAAAK